MNIVFFGTPPYVMPILKSLHKEFKGRDGVSPIVAVVTQQPRPSGRNQKLKYSEIDHWAHKKSIPKYYKSSNLVDNKIQADIGVLAAYGEIVSRSVLELFPHGVLNIHPSLLPKYRGASPVQAAITAGDKFTGVTTMRMDKKLDHGPIVSQFEEDIKPQDTTETLRKRLFLRSAEVLKTLIPAYIEGKVNLRKQDHDKATFTTLIRKDDAFIHGVQVQNAIKASYSVKGRAPNEWEIPFIKNYTTQYSPATIHNFIRAMQPWPEAWTKVVTNANDTSQNAQRLKLISSHLELIGVSSRESHKQKAAESQDEAATPISVDSHEDIKLVLDTVQLEGKNPVSWSQFTDAYPDYSF